MPDFVTRDSGKRFDAGSGTYDMGTRRYSAAAQRFIQRDAYFGAFADLGLSADLLAGNRYAFTGGNPVRFVELDGHRPIVDDDDPGWFRPSVGTMAEGDCKSSIRTQAPMAANRRYHRYHRFAKCPPPPPEVGPGANGGGDPTGGEDFDSERVERFFTGGIPDPRGLLKKVFGNFLECALGLRQDCGAISRKTAEALIRATGGDVSVLDYLSWSDGAYVKLAYYTRGARAYRYTTTPRATAGRLMTLVDLLSPQEAIRRLRIDVDEDALIWRQEAVVTVERIAVLRGYRAGSDWGIDIAIFPLHFGYGDPVPFV